MVLGKKMNCSTLGLYVEEKERMAHKAAIYIKYANNILLLDNWKWSHTKFLI